MKTGWIGLCGFALGMIVCGIFSPFRANNYSFRGFLSHANNTSHVIEKKPGIPYIPRFNSQPRGCEKVKHIYFLKVHKAGSTSVQNLFLRFGLEHKLNVLTLFKGYFMSYPSLTFATKLPPIAPKGLENGKYDIYCEHSIFNEKYLSTVLQADTVNIAIVREPLSQLRSTFSFYRIDRLLKLDHLDDPVAAYLSRPVEYNSKVVTNIKALTSNRVAKEFGFLSTKHQLDDYLHYIDSKFLVLIMERLPESLIVMKRKLVWDMKEIIIAQARPGNYVKPKVNATLVALHKAWSPRDYATYEYFSGVMEQRIAAEDNDFAGEVAVFEDYLAKTREFCDVVCAHMATMVKAINREAITSLLHHTQNYAETKWSSGFVISGLDCLLMRLDPSVFREVQKVRLFPENCSFTETKAKAYVDITYCHDLLDNIIPWNILRKPRFASPCY